MYLYEYHVGFFFALLILIAGAFELSNYTTANLGDRKEAQFSGSSWWRGIFAGSFRSGLF